MAGRIEDYALIGDLETAALVGRTGSVDWWCVPRFDSPACFASLLGVGDHGHWTLAPVGDRPCNRRGYRGDTLVLETVWETVDGTVKVTDFMPPRRHGPRIVRVVDGIAGRVDMRSELTVRFDHGRVVPLTHASDRRTVDSLAGPDATRLHCGPGAGDPTVTRERTTFAFPVTAGRRVTLVLGWHPSHLPPPPPPDVPADLDRTLAFWTDWAAGLRYEGPARDAVLRSLVTLKALTYEPTGGVVAAATASLPECIGGRRNWDYRFCWLRDSTFTLSSLLRSGYRREALAWKDWLVRAAAGDPADLQPLYGVAGQRRVPETHAAGCPATRTRVPAGSATPPWASSSSTSTARS